MERKLNFVVPILYKDCKLLPFLKDKIYADFRKDYSNGFKELLKALPLVVHKTRESNCPYCRHMNISEVREPMEGNVEHKAIDCSNCHKRYFLHVANSGFYTTKTDSSDYDVHPIDGLESEEATRMILNKSQVWIEPNKIPKLMLLMEETERQLVEKWGVITPRQLQDAMLISESIARYGVTRQRVRHFINVLTRSFYFIQNSTKSRAIGRWRHAYTNRYDKDRVIGCYLNSCLYILHRKGVIKDINQAISISQFLLQYIPVDTIAIGKKEWQLITSKKVESN